MPLFEEPLHVGRPNIGNRDRLMERMADMLDRRWFTNHGPYVQALEQRLAELIGVKHCLAVCNATVGLEIAVRALGLRGEVIVPAFTFVATAHALQWQEITPVSCDIDRNRHLIDPDRVETMITPRTTGIIGVHTWGRSAPVEALRELAQRRGLALLYHAAHAFACTHRGQMIGSFGACEVFSFHATKFLNSFEGGAIATNDDDLARKIRLMTNFGFQGYDDVGYVGTNGKVTEICAVMGLTSLESIDEFVAANERNFLVYERELSGLPGVTVLGYEPGEGYNYQYVVIELDEASAGVSRDTVIDRLQAENVIARRYFHPGVHRMEPYRSLFPHAPLLLPVTEEGCRRVIVLPTGTAVFEDTVRRVCGLLRRLIESR